jgi:hypothetical protein
MTDRRARATTKADMLAWVEAQLAKDARLRARVDVQLNRFQLEQELGARREARGEPRRSGRPLAGG